MSKSVKIAVIIPCYNEEENVLNLFKEISETSFPTNYEVIPVFINDCSMDQTKKILYDREILHIDLPVNLGIGGAVQAGYKFALRNQFDIAVQMDGDGQHPPSELKKLIEPIVYGQADVVIGSRFITGEGFQSSYLRRSGIRFFKWLNEKLTGITIHDSTSGYRALNQKALELVNIYYPDEYPEPEAVVLYALHQLKIKEVQVSMRNRQGGESSIRAYKTVYYMVKVSLSTIFLYIRLKFNGKFFNPDTDT